MNKLRIIFITTLSRSKGGAIIATSRLSKILKKNYIVKFLTPDDNNLINIFKSFIATILKLILIGKTRYLNSLNIFSKVKIKASNYDIIHLNWTGQELISIDQLSFIKKPIIWTMHDMWVPNATEHFLNITYMIYSNQ